MVATRTAAIWTSSSTKKSYSHGALHILVFTDGNMSVELRWPRATPLALRSTAASQAVFRLFRPVHRRIHGFGSQQRKSLNCWFCNLQQGDPRFSYSQAQHQQELLEQGRENPHGRERFLSTRAGLRYITREH
ncbi:hypothetical protein RRG08_056536 [Elysia crispata]|uniref:Uncharacterized protein n=1 Tax=Elysia crispata TaxID=231223 RepID=A0AAE0ZLD2_9GAST|nr:hypothetical protein RRG08_056536 [Elysia crispata]